MIAFVVFCTKIKGELPYKNKHMKIRNKISLASALMAAIPVLLVSVIIGFSISNTGSKLIEEDARKQLVSVREITQHFIHTYFDTIKEEIVTLSATQLAMDASDGFRVAFPQRETELDPEGLTIAERRDELKDYYENQFGPRYQELNHGLSADTEGLLNGLSDAAVAYQHAFIQTNPHPLGEKEKLDTPNENTLYAELHKKYHPQFRQILNSFSLYDIFIIDADTGHVIYSVYKELDYATSLKTGPYADSGLAKAYKGALALGDDEVYLDDFHPYTPSYEGSAMFMGTKIHEGDRVTGVLVFQLPIDKINEVLTHDHQWEKTGLGKSGETIMVDQEYHWVSDVRGLVEDQATYVKELKLAGYDEKLLADLEGKSTNIGFPALKNPAVDKALAGETGIMHVFDHMGRDVITAYSPMELLGHKYAVLSRIYADEALAAVDELVSETIIIALVVSLIVIMIAVVFAWRFSTKMSEPIAQSAEFANRVADGDLSGSLTVSSHDEVGDMANALQGMNMNLTQLIGNVADISDQVKDVSDQLDQGTISLEEQTESQSACLLETSSNMASMTETVQKNAEHSESARHLANQASAQAEESKAIVAGAIDAMEEIEKANKQIGDIISVIDEIAFQTNLLALNASVEAARAGEQGRGFAVVAEEVRTLAQRSGEASNNIKTLINESYKKVENGTKLVDNSVTALNSIIDDVKKITAAINEIANISVEQSSGIAESNTGIQQIDHATQQNMILVQETRQISAELKEKMGLLGDEIKQFKLQ